MLDEHIENFRRQTELRWDDLRERRVLGEVERSLAARHSRRQRRPRRLPIVLPLSLGFAALILTYFVGVDIGKKRTVGPRLEAPFLAAPSLPASTHSEGALELEESRVLADGSRLEMSHAARVEVRTESKKRVELAQNDGRVRYQVPPVPGRAFVILARGVQVQVKGTVFVVDVDAGKVSVKVEQGLVRVVASSGEVELGVGDELSTPADPEAASDASSEMASALDGSPPRASRSQVAPAPQASVLLDRADAERRSGDLASASATLHELLNRYPNDRRAALAWFTLGKVERARDRAAAAAKAFQISFTLAPEGPVGEDALAEEAVAWAAANNPSAARTAAEQYSRRFPTGTHLARMQRILE